jgi:hypothetical protein
MAGEPLDIPHGMKRIYRRFARWRSDHPGVRLPIPGRLWASAAEVAREHGICRTAQVLGLEYGKLKRLAESGNAVTKAPTTRARRSKSATSSPMFMELVESPTIGVSECLIELEGPHGKMRVQWKGTTTPDLAGLSRALWERT